jgi:hypothetical protein
MDETTERKVRDLKLKILHVERELSGAQHHSGVSAMLRVGHPGQIAKAGERERKRLETKLEELKSKLEALEPGSVAKPIEAAAPEPVSKEKAAPVKTETAAKTTKKTAKK